MTTRVTAMVLWLGVVVAGAPAAFAQECGDADGNGAVTVTDGVQALRAAAGLDSACSVATCDVDGSGAISVTDGVNVLRKAAGLAIDERCGGGGGAGQPATVLRELQPLLRFGFPFATGAPVTTCANAPDGELEVTTEEEGTLTTLFDCHVGAVSLYGDVLVGPSVLALSLFEAETSDDNEDFIADYDGELTLGTAGAARTLDGLVEINTESAGALEATVEGVTVTNGTLTGGRMVVDLEFSDISDAFTRLELTFDGSGVANVVATQANGGAATFRLDIATGNLV